MKNGLYSVHIHMLDGVRGRDSGVLFLRDGELIGGDPISGRSAHTPSITGHGKVISAPISTRPLPTPSFARYSPGRKSPADFQGRLPTTGPRCSAPPWLVAEA